ncbi:hypothetical protein C8R43DRAFT_306582 [Mycena crocata]|nr:hypothetical protein C8R43DRAFT_306582 [Mycena crocata]
MGGQFFWKDGIFWEYMYKAQVEAIHTMEVLGRLSSNLVWWSPDRQSYGCRAGNSKSRLWQCWLVDCFKYLRFNRADTRQASLFDGMLDHTVHTESRGFEHAETIVVLLCLLPVQTSPKPFEICISRTPNAVSDSIFIVPTSTEPTNEHTIYPRAASNPSKPTAGGQRILPPIEMYYTARLALSDLTCILCPTLGAATTRGSTCRKQSPAAFAAYSMYTTRPASRLVKEFQSGSA